MKFGKDAAEIYKKVKYMEAQEEKLRKRLQTDHSVFISYSSVDHKIAKRISKVMAELEISHFFDKKDINWGQEVVEGIARGLKNCTHLVVIVSPASLKSSWVAFEIGQAAALNKGILPFLTHPSLDIPDFIKAYHYISNINELKAFFQKPSVDQEELKELFDTVMSRLPSDVDRYLFLPEASVPNKKIWQATYEVKENRDKYEVYGQIKIEGSGTDTIVTLNYPYYDNRRHAYHVISYDISRQVIHAEDTATGLESSTNHSFSWPASASFWKEIIKMLRAKLGDK